MSLGKVGQVSVQTAKKVFTGDYVIPNRIALYGIPKLITPGDIRRALPEKVQGVTNIEIDYRAFRPSRKAVITFSRPEALSGNLRALRPFTVCGTELDAAPHYGLDTLQGTRPRTKVIDGNGLDARFPNIDRSVVLWGMPMGVTIDDISRTLGSEFKVALKDGKPILHKVERTDGKYTRFSRFIVTMATVSEARRLVRAWHLRPWLKNSYEVMRAQHRTTTALQQPKV